MTVDQIFIFLLGVPALWLIGRKEPWHRWGFILGLLAQPFWYYTAIKNHQYGVTILNICYTYCWIQGIYFNFVKNIYDNRKSLQSNK